MTEPPRSNDGPEHPAAPRRENARQVPPGRARFVRPGRLRRRFAIGAVGTAVVALALFLAGLLDGFGLGPGGGGGDQAGLPADRDRPSDPEPQPPRPEVDPGEVVNVRIERDTFYVRERTDGEVERRPVDLRKLLELVERAPGNEQGVRVRIERGPTSIPTTETQLEEALRALGLRQGREYRFVD